MDERDLRAVFGSPKTIGERLQELRRRSGMSMDAVAKAAGYAGASSVQKYFSDDYDPFAGLEARVARRLMTALVGRGNPPIEEVDITDLLYFESRDFLKQEPEVTQPIADTPTLHGRPRDVPVFGTALGADVEIKGDGTPSVVEQTTFEMGEIIAYLRRPPAIDDNRKVYAVFVVGSSMEPRYRAGDPVFVDPYRPPAIGDDVIVQIARNNGRGDREIINGLIKTLTRRNSQLVELEQYNPAARFTLEASEVAQIHRIIPWRECFGI